MYEYIPAELKQLSQWVCHKYPSKIPLCACPDAGGILHPASCNKPATWSSFGQAVKAVKEHGATGIGIQFANGICGIDIDDCVDGGELTAFAREIVETMRSYTEVSPSGTGIHILCKGRLPAREGRRDSSLGLEMYDTGRYFTVTGSAYLDPSGRPYPLRDCTKELDEIHRKYLTPEPVEQTRLDAPKSAAARTPDSRQAVRDLSDQEILEIAFRNKETGDDIRRLYAGDWSSLPQLSGKSQSEADLLFCGHLAFWFDRDGARMDAVFRASGLYRKKWDEKRGAQTYGQKTIAAAIKGTTRTFVPYDRPRGGEKPLPEPPPESSSRKQGPLSGGAQPSQSAQVKPDPGRYTLDDTGNAYRFRDAFWRDLRYDHVNGRWMYWTGKRWAVDETGEVKRRANALLERMEEEARSLYDNGDLLKHVRKTRSSKYKEAMIREAQPLEGIPVLPGELDLYQALLNVQNGVLNLKTGELLPHKREYMLSMIAAVEYDPAAECPRWMQFLDEITCGDVDLALYLQRMVGYCLTASTREQCIFFLWGSGGNGKSRFVEAVTSLLGDYTKNSPPEAIIVKDRSSPNTSTAELARMKSVRLLTTSEPDGGCRLAEGMVKRITGEDVVTARLLYKASFDYKPEFKVVMSTNAKPVITGSDQGIWRRVRLIPFTAQFPPEKQDRDLGDRLAAERPGIFRWAVQGAIDWYRYGMPRCLRVDNANEDYRNEMDRVKEFIDDCLVRTQGSALPSHRIYAVYRAWAEENGERYPLGQKKFSTELVDNHRFFRRKTMRFSEFLDVEFSAIGREYLAMAPQSPTG